MLPSVLQILSLAIALSYGGGVIDEVRQLCPYMDFCTVGRLSNMNMTLLSDTSAAPCCMNCYCDQDCWKFQDCCSDAQGPSNDSVHAARCVSTVVHSALPNIETNSIAGKLPSYLMIDYCPNYNFADVDIARKCREDFPGIPDFDDLAVVSKSDNYNDIYKNKYCAACHGVLDVVRWDFYIVNCPLAADGDTPFSETKQHIWKNCLMYSSPPGGMVFPRNLFECHDRTMRKTCSLNETRDTPLERRCEQGHYYPFIVDTGFFTVWYKNPYCYWCNKGASIDTPSLMCPARTHVQFKYQHFWSSMLLDRRYENKMSARIRTERGSIGCNESELYDPSTRRCRRLHCPWNSVPVYGNCVLFSSSVTNVQTGIVFLFRSVTDSVSLSDALDPNGEISDFVNKLARHFSLPNCTVNELYISRLSKDEDVYLIVDITFAVVGSCKFTDVVSNLNRLSTQSLQLNLLIQGQPKAFQGRVHFLDLHHPNHTLSSYEKKVLFRLFTFPQYSGIKQRVFMCPYITLILLEYNALVPDAERLTEISPLSVLVHGFHVMPNESIAACNDTYFGYVKGVASRCHVPDVLLIREVIINVMALHLVLF